MSHRTPTGTRAQALGAGSTPTLLPAASGANATGARANLPRPISSQPGACARGKGPTSGRAADTLAGRGPRTKDFSASVYHLQSRHDGSRPSGSGRVGRRPANTRRPPPSRGLLSALGDPSPRPPRWGQGHAAATGPSAPGGRTSAGRAGRPCTCSPRRPHPAPTHLPSRRWTPRPRRPELSPRPAPPELPGRSGRLEDCRLCGPKACDGSAHKSFWMCGPREDEDGGARPSPLPLFRPCPSPYPAALCRPGDSCLRGGGFLGVLVTPCGDLATPVSPARLGPNFGAPALSLSPARLLSLHGHPL